MMPNQSHAPTPATLKIHHSALARVTQTLGPLWIAERDCVTTDHEAYRKKLQKLKVAVREVAACCQECRDTNAEWDRFEAERPTALERVRAAEEEAQAERKAIALAFSFNPDVDSAPVPFEHPDGCGCPGCVAKALREGQDSLRTLATANTSLDSERRCG